MGLFTAIGAKEVMMPQEHSPRDGTSRPPERHRIEQSADEQREYFTEERRRKAKPKNLIRTSPPEPKAGEEQD
ncbi:hypothetical protein OF385_08880 [Glutamicibacter sp. JL.03c]|uniref:hypothetical protein n=1 Tax=Glutamicibacter sp. JL.03c TaxID=2984842 RepID=UPI0021F756B1|nr:hypothetical protein [Glutamicibacter sp. JL.03c]UYQ76178.1 hypothetical protein OF385_08880 [Glutamicibacter sp. JL.03c]